MMTVARNLSVVEMDRGRNRMDLNVHPELPVRLKMEQEDVTVTTVSEETE